VVAAAGRWSSPRSHKEHNKNRGKSGTLKHISSYVGADVHQEGLKLSTIVK
jgi:hypothetical protein